MVIGPSINQSTNQSINRKILKVTVPNVVLAGFGSHFLICWLRSRCPLKDHF